MATEEQHHLDIVMDSTKAQWDWITQILALYRSAVVPSNGLYKLITDRADLPIRQVFHVGNTIPGKNEVRIGGNPVKPNEIIATYSDQNNHYTQDTITIQDSVAIYVRNEPIKPIDASFTGLTRQSEVMRQASLILQRAELTKRQITWATGLEGLAVEPGDRCKVGVLMTDFQTGYGGRAVDGSSAHIVFDMPVTVQSGYTYELLVWHTAADTPESRTLGNSPGAWIVGSPTAPFDYQIMPQDRWAVGINSEDLFDLRVLEIQRQPDGSNILTGEQFIPIDFSFECRGPATLSTSAKVPANNPFSMTVTISDCNLCVQFPQIQPASIGGTIVQSGPVTAIGFSNPGWGTGISAFVAFTSSGPPEMTLYNQFINFVDGAAAGKRSIIQAWYPNSTAAGGNANANAEALWWNPPTPQPNSGDHFYISPQSNAVAEFQVLRYSVGSDYNLTDTQFELIGRTTGTSACFDVLNTSDRDKLAVVMINSWGYRNIGLPWIVDRDAPGCNDFSFVSDVHTYTGSATNLLYGAVIPGSRMGLRNQLNQQLQLFITECCSAANEATDLRFTFQYGSVTVIDSLVVSLNTTTSLTPMTGSGVALPATLTLQMTELTPQIYTDYSGDMTSHDYSQFATMTYAGPADSIGYVQIAKTGISSVNPDFANSYGILVTFRHTSVATPSLPHSHGCFLIWCDNAQMTFTNVDSGLDPIVV